MNSISQRIRLEAILAITVLAAQMCLIAASDADAGELRTDKVIAVSTGAAPELNGAASDSWDRALSVDEFTDVTSRQAAALSTRAQLLYDSKNLYVHFVCDQTAESISDSHNVEDVIAGTDDYVSIDLDPSGVGARSYSFMVTPNGLKYQTSSESSRYFPFWTGVGFRNQSGYAVSMVIPLDVLRARSGANRSWRVNFRRHIGNRNDDYSWAYDPKSATYLDPATWPLLTRLSLQRNATRPPAHAAIYALDSSGPAANTFENGLGEFSSASQRHVGIDGTIPITNTLAAVATVNPDFSNVEFDQTTIAPQQYVRSLSEYRPFFLQGAQYVTPLPELGITSAPNIPFYTPAIGSFNEGLKIEGTEGPQSLGVLQVTGDGFSDQAYGYQYARADNELVGSFEGVTAHSDGLFDQTSGVGLIRKNNNSGEATSFSYSQERGSATGLPSDANDLTVAESLSTQRWTAVLGYRSTGPSYAPILGYTAVNDVKGPEAVLAYNGSGGKKGFIKTYNITVAGDRFLNRAGANNLSDAISSLTLTTKNLITLGATSQSSEQKLYDIPFPVYLNSHNFKFDQTTVLAGFKDNTATPTDVSYSFGPFAVLCYGSATPSGVCGKTTSAPFVQSVVSQESISTTQRLGRFYTLSAQYSGVQERELYGSLSDGQWLRGLSLSRGVGLDSSVAVQLRTISGSGGFAEPGVNVSAQMHVRFRNLNELYLDLGSPASVSTLNRYVLKYIINVGSGSGS